jgi:hypothetical protein
MGSSLIARGNGSVTEVIGLYWKLKEIILGGIAGDVVSWLLEQVKN